MYAKATQDLRLIKTAQLVVELGWGGEQGVRGKHVTISGSPSNFLLVEEIVRAAYHVGARNHTYVPLTPELTALHLNAHAENGEWRNEVPAIWSDSWNQLVDERGCTVRIEAPDAPLALSFCKSAHVAERMIAEKQARARFYDEGLFAAALPWNIIPRATPGWAEMLFPGDPNGTLKLQEVLDQILMTDRENCLELWRKELDASSRRSEVLNSLNAVALHFEGPGTDLTVGLTELASFSGARKTTSGGVTHVANLPTFENFTTPDHRLTRGHVTCTRPVKIDGIMVKGLKVWFADDGTVSKFEAEKEYQLFKPSSKRRVVTLLVKLLLLALMVIPSMSREWCSRIPYSMKMQHATSHSEWISDAA